MINNAETLATEKGEVTIDDLLKLKGAGATLASGTQQAAIANPAGGSTDDEEARAAIVGILSALRAFGIIAPNP